MGKIIDMTGERYGNLIVLEKVSKKGAKNSLWKCKCDCGNEIIVSRPNLRNGQQSCGCLRPKKENILPKSKWIDETGNVYGYLTVIEKIGTTSSGNALLKCQCKCGNITVVPSNNLRSGKSQSCGCASLSKGERVIREILKDNNIPYMEQKTFDSCRFEDTNALAKFDFYVDNKYVIEYDGEQHFNIGGWGEDFEKIHQRDLFKNQWCKRNNIPLIRIPYTHFMKLRVEDLKLETSKYII